MEYRRSPPARTFTIAARGQEYKDVFVISNLEFFNLLLGGSLAEFFAIKFLAA
jgi:hypothetical protein